MCVQEEKVVTGTETTKMIEKHIPAVSISSNLRSDPVALSSSNSRELVSSFVDACENLASEAKIQMREQFFEAEIPITIKLLRVQASLNKLQSNQEATFHFEDECCRAQKR